MKEKEVRVAMFISGGGSTAEAVIRGCQDKEIVGIVPVAVISSRPDALGLQKAQKSPPEQP